MTWQSILCLFKETVYCLKKQTTVFILNALTWKTKLISIFSNLENCKKRDSKTIEVTWGSTSIKIPSAQRVLRNRSKHTSVSAFKTMLHHHNTLDWLQSFAVPLGEEAELALNVQ